MIRLVVLSVGFVASTAALLWVLGEPPEADTPVPDQVRRAEPAPMGFDAFIPQPIPARPEPTRPVERPAGLAATAAAQAPAPQPARQAPAPQPVLQAAPNLTGGDDEVMNALRAMSYGVLNELKKPADTARAPAPTPPVARSAALAPREPAAAVPSGRTYTVQRGDSLPGIAFRYYGTTVAYLQILEANTDILSDPAQLRPGMVLRIPEGN